MAASPTRVAHASRPSSAASTDRCCSDRGATEMKLNPHHARKSARGGASLRTQPRHVDHRIPNYRSPTEPASRSRVRRNVERWPGTVEVSRLAQIVVLHHGGHNRPIITRGGKHLRSRMGSRKTGLQQIVEGRGHRDFTMWNEINPQVLDFQAHPFHIRFQAHGEWFDYYPDHIRIMRDGTIELIEVKRSVEDLGNAKYCTKLGIVAEIARRAGWNFRILYHADITGPRWRMMNVEAVYSRRFMSVSRQEQAAISSFVAAGAKQTWAKLRDQVSPDDCRRGNAVIENAIALGRIDIDFDQRITDATVVLPLEPVSHNRQIRL